MKKQLSQAVELYESFREARPRKLAKLSVKLPRVVACMGHTEAIDYRTTHEGKTTLYRHHFAKGSRPLLCVSSDGTQIMLIGGKYQWTDRGIVDKDARGRERPDPKHGKTLRGKARNPRSDDTTTSIWKWSPVTGTWRHERTCQMATAKQWMALFQSDDPYSTFHLGLNRPSRKPK